VNEESAQYPFEVESNEGISV